MMEELGCNKHRLMADGTSLCLLVLVLDHDDGDSHWKWSLNKMMPKLGHSGSLNHDIPLKTGQIFHTPSPPIPKNCPRDVSRKKVGIPAPIRHNKYGTRKAPEIDKGFQLTIIHHLNGVNETKD